MVRISSAVMLSSFRDALSPAGVNLRGQLAS